MSKSSRVILLLSIILIFFIYLFVYIVYTCSCGHHLIKILPSIIFTCIQIFVYFKIYKLNNWKIRYTILFIICSILIYSLVFFLSLNDMEELHRMDVEPYI